MTPPQTNGRTVHKRGDEAAVLGLLRSIFAAELVRPSRTLWLVSPWISDVPLLDNRLDGYRHLEPQWPRAEIRLGMVLATLAARGTTLVVATRPARPVAPDEGSRVTDRFLEDLERRIPASAHLELYRDLGRIHTKGLLGEGYLLAGSMNFTYSGVKVNDELVRFTTSSAEVAETRIEFRGTWSDV